MKRHCKTIATAACIALAMTFFAACQNSKQKGETASENVVGTTEETFGQFKIADLDRNEQDVSDLISKQRYTIIDFWASWCAPCRKEMPTLVALYGKYKDSGLGIIGISLDSDYNEWKEAVNSLNMTWQQLSELRGWESEAGESLSVDAIPFTVVVDSQSKIIAKNLRGKQLTDFIDSLMKSEKK